MIDRRRYTSTGQWKQHWPAAIDLTLDDLTYDIKNNAYLEGEVLTEDQGALKHLVQGVCDEGNLDKVVRSLDLAFAECQEMLYAYTKEGIKPITWQADNPYLNRVYHMVMTLPPDFSQTSVELLRKSIHEYMVSEALGDWLSIVLPAASPKYAARAEALEAQIRAAVNRRTGRVRRTLSPY